MGSSMRASCVGSQTRLARQDEGPVGLDESAAESDALCRCADRIDRDVWRPAVLSSLAVVTEQG